MATTAELIKKEDDALKKARDLHRARLKKYEDIEIKRLFKILKQTRYFEFDFTDQELLTVFETMVRDKSEAKGKLVQQNNGSTSKSVVETDSRNELEQVS